MNPNNNLLIAQSAQVFKAIAHPTRLWIIEQLSKGEACVCIFTEKLDVDFSTISKHLTVLKNAGIVESEKRGKQVFYSLTLTCVIYFISCIKENVKQNLADKLKSIESL